MRSRPVVLIADDTRDQLDLYELALADRFTIIAVTTGAAAVSTALASRPDAIVLDVLMPGEDGFATCARLKSDPATSETPVLLLTACDDVDVEGRAIAAGASQLLHKPCSAARLATTLDAAIAARNRIIPA